jgi:hypothetical protein
MAQVSWSVYEKGRLNEYEGFIKHARSAVYTMPPPWREEHEHAGRPFEHNARALVVCLLLKMWLGKAFRDLTSFLKGNEQLWVLIGITSLPSRSTLQRAMNRLSEEYLEELNRRVVEPYRKKGL